MDGLIGKIKANSGKRDELISILIAGSEKMPGCLSYIVAKDVADTDAIWPIICSICSHMRSASLFSMA